MDLPEVKVQSKELLFQKPKRLDNIKTSNMGQLKWYQEQKPIIADSKPSTPLVKNYELPRALPSSQIPERMLRNSELKSIITRLLSPEAKNREKKVRQASTSFRVHRAHIDTANH